MIEVEMKLELTPHALERLQQQFDSSPSLQFLHQIAQRDSYYDTQDHTCLQQAIFLRVRNRTSLEIKYHDVADPLHTQCIERVFSLHPEPHDMEELNELGARFIAGWRKATTVEDAFALNALAEFVRIEKQRKLYRYEDVLLCIDTIPGLGHFLELEISCKGDQEVAKAYERLQEVLTHFALSSLNVIHLGYVELWLSRHYPHVYQLVTSPQSGVQNVEKAPQRTASPEKDT